MTSNNASTRMAPWLEQAWLARYLDWELDANETAWFEAYALDNDDLLDHIHADTLLRQGLQSAQSAQSTSRIHENTSAQTSDGSVAPAANANVQQLAPRSRASSAALRTLALAASLVLGVGIGVLAISWQPPRKLPEAIGEPMRLTYHTLRGGSSATPDVEPGDSNSPYVRVEVILPAGARDVKFHLRDTSSSTDGSGQPRAVSLLIPKDERVEKVTCRVGDESTEVSLKAPEIKRQPETH